MNGIYKGLLPLLLVGLVAYLVGGSGKGQLRSQVRAAQNMAAQTDSLRTVADDLQERLAVVQDSERDLRTVMEERVPVMAARIRELEGSEIALVETQAVLDSVRAQGVARDTIIVTVVGEDTVEVYQVEFTHSQPGIRVDVMTRTPPPTFRLSVDLDPVDLTIGIFQLPTGQVAVDVQTPPWVTLGALETNITLPGPTWWERHDFKVGVGLGILGVLLILSAGG